MQGKSIAECSKGSILQCFRPSLSYYLSIKSFFFLFFSSIPLNIHEVWPRPFWGGSSLQNKTPVDHSIGHIPFASLEGDKRPDKINQNPECLNILCPKQENNV